MDEVALDEIRSPAELPAIVPAWGALCDRAPDATPFARPEWLLAWVRAFAPRELAVLVARRGERIAAIAPWFVFGDAPERTLALLGAGPSDYCDAIADPADRDRARAWIEEHLAGASSRVDRVVVDAVSHGSLAHAIAPPPGFVAREEEQDPCPALALGGDAVPAKQWTHFRKARRRAEPIGRVALRLAEPGERARVVARMIELVCARHADAMARRLALLVDGASSAFAARGALRLFVLSIGGDDAAYLLGFEEKRALYCYWQAWDERFARTSPGMLLVGEVIARATKDGLAAIDMLRGREAYKYAWGAVDKRCVRRIFQREG